MGEEDAKVHVGNLPYRVTEDELRDKFEKYGNVSEGTSFPPGHAGCIQVRENRLHQS